MSPPYVMSLHMCCLLQVFTRAHEQLPKNKLHPHTDRINYLCSRPWQLQRHSDFGPSSLTPTWVSRFRRMPLQVCVCDAPKLCSVLINHEDFPASICSIDPAARRPTTWQRVPLLFSSLLQHSPDNRLFLHPCCVIIDDDQHYDGGSIKIVSIRIILNCQVMITNKAHTPTVFGDALDYSRYCWIVSHIKNMVLFKFVHSYLLNLN